MIEVRAYAAQKAKGDLAPWKFNRRDLGPNDVLVEIVYSGICHSDIHQVREEWGEAIFPMVPGHEIAGIVKEVGSSVTRFKPGMRAGVGVFIDSCRFFFFHCFLLNAKVVILERNHKAQTELNN